MSEQQQDATALWHAGTSDELAFWRMALGGETEYLRQRLENMLSPEGRLAKFPVRLLPQLQLFKLQNGRPADTLDIGSGPLSTLAWAHERDLARVVAIDPLADEYASMLGEFRYEYPITATRCYGERLTSQFPPNHFDVVYSRNAVDHCVSPHQVVREATTVLRPGGVLFLEGAVAEGTHQGWQGLHQHDILPTADDLLHRGRDGVTSSLLDGLPLRRLFSGTGQDGAEPASSWQENDWYVLMWEKVGEDGG